MSDRSELWALAEPGLDVAVIGGGITGVAVLLEAARRGLRAGLFEAHDFASGTSSRSSKLVHGGLRYLKNAQVRSTYQAVRERRRLLDDEPALVRPLSNTLLAYRGERRPPWTTGLGLAVYDALARQWAHERQSPREVADRLPGVSTDGLLAGHHYAEATTDDAGLVLAVLGQARAAGALALNYAPVEGVNRRATGEVAGLSVRDLVTGATHEIPCQVVVNATGAWSDDVRGRDGRGPVLRRLRGSHLFFPSAAFPLQGSVSFMHPADGRPVFAYPWAGVTLVGTTDVDHDEPMTTDVRCTPAEVDYLMAGVDKAFGALGLKASDAVSSIGGVRPVVRGRQVDPSKVSREALLLDEDGLVSIVGGKLTTFRPMARQALVAALRHVGVVSGPAVPAPASVSAVWEPGPGLVATAVDDVVHLDDLLLRRSRLGLTSPGGGLAQARESRADLQRLLRWDDERWAEEERRYGDLWRAYYSPPE